MPSLRDLRKAAGMTQKELAERVGVTPNTVTRWEMDWGSGQESHASRPMGSAKKSLGLIFGVDPETITYGAARAVIQAPAKESAC